MTKNQVNSLTFSELRAANVSRSKRWHSGSLENWSLSDWGVAMAGEAGEACNIIKKLNRERDRMVGNSTKAAELRMALAEELADTLIYLDLLAARANVDLGAAVIAKFNRVSVKNNFPERLPPEEGL